MHSVLPFHTPFGLRGVRRQDVDAQLRAHSPELRQRFFAAQFLLGRGRHFVDVLPVGVQRQRHAVLRDPQTQRVHRGPGGFFFSKYA